jgi:hypothetical protein
MKKPSMHNILIFYTIYQYYIKKYGRLFNNSFILRLNFQVDFAPYLKKDHEINLINEDFFWQQTCSRYKNKISIYKGGFS